MTTLLRGCQTALNLSESHTVGIGDRDQIAVNPKAAEGWISNPALRTNRRRQGLGTRLSREGQEPPEAWGTRWAAASQP